jgi:hypothetical protein
MPAMVVLVDGTVPVAADFNGNYTALNNAIGSATAISAWAIGEIPYASATNTLARLTPGSAGQVLTMGVSIPAWASAAGLTDQLTGLALSNNGADATNDIDIAVGAAASADAAIANRVFMSLTSALTKQLDVNWVVGTNQGGLDTGAIGNNTYHVHLIERVDTGVVDALFSLSATAPTMPTNYTKSRRIGSIMRESAAIVLFDQDGDRFQRKASVLDVANATPGTSANTATLKVPTGIVVVALLNLNTANSTRMYVSSLAVNDEAVGTTTTPLASIGTASASVMNVGPIQVSTNTSAQIRYRADANALVQIATLGWIDRRGKG